MNEADRDIEAEAMGLPSRERARLAERLLASLEEAPELETEEDWRQEAERRLAELESGRVAGIPAAEAFRKARAALL